MIVKRYKKKINEGSFTDGYKVRTELSRAIDNIKQHGNCFYATPEGVEFIASVINRYGKNLSVVDTRSVKEIVSEVQRHRGTYLELYKKIAEHFGFNYL